NSNGITLERPRGGAFEINAVFIKTAAVAGAFELLFAFEPIGRTPEVSANRAQGVNLLLAVVFAIDDPHAELGDKLGFHLSRGKILFETYLKLARGLGQDIGEHEACDS